MKYKVFYDRPKGSRIKRAGLGKKRSYCMYIENVKGLWFSEDLNRWIDFDEAKDMAISSRCYANKHSVYTLKSAIRLIGKWDLVKGTIVKVECAFIGYDVSVLIK